MMRNDPCVWALVLDPWRFADDVTGGNDYSCDSTSETARGDELSDPMRRRVVVM